MALDILEGGVKYLAVPIGSPARGTALSRILALKGSPGWIAAPPMLKEWRFTGVTEQADGTVLYGPWMPARTLTDTMRLPPAEALPFLIRLAEALQLLKERSITLFPFQTDAVLFCDDGSVLFLPAEVMRELRELRPFSMNRDTFESINNPDTRGEDMISFALGVLLYRAVTGAFPFTGESPEDIHEQMRKLEILSPAEAAPGVGEEASQLIMAALARSRRKRPDLDEWVESLRAWRKDGALRNAAAGVTTSASPTAQKRFHRRVFWEKNWRTALIIAGVVIVIGFGLGSILRNVLAPRVTRGYSPQKVVRTFYESMNRLDQLTMGACVVDGAGKGDINEVTNLYVISRVSTGYEGRSNIVAADAWDKAGRPPIPFPQTLYGVTGLVIAPEKPEPTPVFLVTYDKWTPVPASDTATPNQQQSSPRYEGHAVQDRVFMKKDRGDWVIYRIDRVRSAPLPLP
jgi:hypothetical protein